MHPHTLNFLMYGFLDVNDVLCQQRQYIQLFTTAEPFDYWAFQRSKGLLPAVYFSVWLGCAPNWPSLSAGSLAGNRLASLLVVCWLCCRKQKNLPGSSNLSRPGDLLSQALTATGLRNCSAVTLNLMLISLFLLTSILSTSAAMIRCLDS